MEINIGESQRVLYWDKPLYKLEIKGVLKYLTFEFNLKVGNPVRVDDKLLKAPLSEFLFFMLKRTLQFLRTQSRLETLVADIDTAVLRNFCRVAVFAL